MNRFIIFALVIGALAALALLLGDGEALRWNKGVFR